MQHSTSARWLANPKYRPYPFFSIFLELMWMSSSLSKWLLLCLLVGHVGFPSYVDFWAYNGCCILSMHSNLFWTCVFLVFILAAIPNHIPLKYRCPVEIVNWNRHVYLRVYFMLASHVLSPIAFKFYSAIDSDVQGLEESTYMGLTEYS